MLKHRQHKPWQAEKMFSAELISMHPVKYLSTVSALLNRNHLADGCLLEGKEKEKHHNISVGKA